MHVVHADMEIPLVVDAYERRIGFDCSPNGEDCLASRLFYVNMFYIRKREQTVFKES